MLLGRGGLVYCGVFIIGGGWGINLGWILIGVYLVVIGGFIMMFFCSIDSFGFRGFDMVGIFIFFWLIVFGILDMGGIVGGIGMSIDGIGLVGCGLIWLISWGWFMFGSGFIFFDGGRLFGFGFWWKNG